MEFRRRGAARRCRRAVVSGLSLSCAAVAYLASAQPASRAAIETIVVTDRALEGELDLTPGGVTLVDADDLRARNVASLADLLRYVPGVWSASAAGNDNLFLSSRGSNLDSVHYDFNGLKLLQDGLPVTAADGNNHNRFVDPQSMRFATVARGANAMKYGASTLGGAIDFVSPTARGGARREVSVNAGSHGHSQLRGTFGGILNERVDALVTLEAKSWDGFREHNEQERRGAYANFGWQPSNAVDTRLFATFIENDQELPGVLTRTELDTDPSLAEPRAVSGNYRFDVETARLASKTTVELGNGRSLELGFSFERQQLFHPIVDRVMVPIGGVPTEVFSLLIDTEQRDAGMMARFRQRVGDHDLVLGMNYGDNTVEGSHYRNLGGQRNGLTTLVDNSAESLEIYALDRWHVAAPWVLELAAQGVSAVREVRNVTTATGEKRNPRGRFSRVNPRFGFIRSIGERFDVYGNVSSLYEPPTNYQLEDEATGTSAALDAMHGAVVELGVRGRRLLERDGFVAFDVALYRAQIRDEILSIDDSAAPGTSLSSNVDRTSHAGIEAVVSAELSVGARGAVLAPVVSVTFNDFSFDGDAVYGDRDLPAAPGRVVRGELVYRFANGAFVGPTFDSVDARFADFANTYRIESYSLLGLRAGWQNGRWSAFGEVKNARDERYVATHNVVDAAGADARLLNPGEPRSVYFGVSARF